MMGFSTKMRIVSGVIGLALVAAPSASAAGTVRVRTPSLVPDPNGYLECRVVVTSPTAIGVVAAIRTSNGLNVTEFGTGFRASPAASGDGLYHAEETAGSLSNRARYCTATVTGAARDDVHLTLTAFDANHEAIDSVRLP